jgi:hypothetical protein
MLPRTSESLPILFKSNMSGDLATRTACDTDVHFVEIRSVVRDEELHLVNSAVTVAQKIII